jgi:hypothetical protein
MGLDSFIFETRWQLPSLVDFPEIEDAKQIAYWRKKHDLHEWMYQLYKSKGGITTEEGFNLVPVQITKEDLDNSYVRNLKVQVRDKDEEEICSFIDGDLFLPIALVSLAEGNKLFYVSWW